MSETTWTQDAGMSSPTEADNVENYSEQAEASKDAAAASATAAASSATSASSSASTASTKAAEVAASVSAAASSATQSASSATSAASSAATAGSAQTAAETAKTGAETAQTAAETAKAAAETAQTAAETAETNAETSETNASNSATAAASEATAAAGSATAASASASSASAAQTAAETAETNAETAETGAQAAQTAAETAETNAETAETNAAASASAASGSAIAAASSATAASGSAAAAAGSASAASTSASDAAAALDEFTDLYLGSKGSDPTLDNDGNALQTGALYHNNSDDLIKFYNGSAWITAYATLSGALIGTNNLSDVASVSAARTNLGLGTAQSPSFNNVTVQQDPTTSLQLATKQYVDTIAAAGLHYHDPVRVEAPSALTVTYNNGSSGVGATLTNAGTQAALAIDGITLQAADRVLIYTQADATQNGVYTVTNVGSGSTNWVMTRSTDTDSYAPSDPDSFGEGDAFFVKEGNTGAGELYVMNTSGTITFGTTNITFTQVASTAVYTADGGLDLTGTVFSHADTSSQATVNNSGATVIQDVTLDGYGHVTALGSHTLTLANLGYTGATNANYITNNNQLTNGAGYTTNVGDITGVTAGGGISGGGTSGTVTISHADTSSQASVNGSGRTYIQDITLDTYGHVTGIATATETVVNTDTNTTYSAGAGLDLSGTTFSIESDVREHGNQYFGGSGGEFTYYDNSNALVRFYVNSSEEMRLESDGDLHVDGNVVAYSTTISDERLKTDIVKIDSALDKVDQINGYTFTYTADGKKSAGVIAQEVEKVLPSAVTESTLPLKMGEDDKTEYKTVQYDQLIGLLVEAVKELKAEVAELKGK